MRWTAALAAALLFLGGGGTALAADEGEASPREFAAEARRDMAFIVRQRTQLQAFQQCLRDNETLFRRKALGPRVLTVEEKATVRAAWQSLLDRYYALDSLRQAHAGYAAIRHRPSQFLSFRCHAAAFFLQYRHALEFLALDPANPDFDAILNEAMPELGLPADTYADFKGRFLCPAAAAEFASLQAQTMLYRQQGFVQPDNEMEADIKFIWRMGRGPGLGLTAANAATTVRRTLGEAFFPVQAGISEWMGDTRVGPQRAPLVTPAQLAGLRPRLRPGDILLERREWYLSNVGLPGYWPHAALYIGTAEERRAWLGDALTQEWVRTNGVSNGDIEALLMAQHGEAYRRSLQADDGGPFRVIEAMSEGVVFTSFEHSAACDSLAVLRPRVANPVRAQAILRAFAMHGRPYDFDFDFRTDAAIVCTELVCKAYEPGSATRGRSLRFPVSEILGRQVVPANEMVRTFDSEFGLFERQLELIAFLDGNLAVGQAVPADADAFRASWRRPKWHLLATALAEPAPAIGKPPHGQALADGGRP